MAIGLTVDDGGAFLKALARYSAATAPC